MKITGAVLESLDSPSPFAESRPIRIRELELDAPGPHEVLVRIEAAGVCHSDLSVLTGVRPRAVPLLLGHEAAGIVEALGAEVDDLAVGQRVVMTFLPRCGHCASCASDGRTPCENGSAANGAGRLLDGAKRIHVGAEVIDHHLGVSAFADHAVVDRRSIVPVGDDVPPQVAALMGCAVLTGGGAVLNAARLQPGETLIVVGLGGVGMAALLVGLAVEGARVIGVDANPDKLAQARALGAHETYGPAEAVEAGVKAPAVVEAVGRAVAFETALALTAPGGRTVTVGLPAPDDLASVSPLALVSTGRTIIGSYLGSSIPARDIPIFVDLWRRGLLPVESLVSSEIHLGEINEAMDSLARGESIRQIIVPEGQALRRASDSL
ncbi:alcohol dehydrogenase [Subtercola boreus]|uniref:Alcohol dehydrogenase n=1 Tax=Subtercola boreus TaxID=120213 RepID=A0A3E0VMU9_9MICO|nr:alcohol dehydrogenase catalytic domain-containing protein [Subtercola boreus]RFA10790.1 alcohol dehydrogenase [Subtercola boreus]TQL55635.1 alcohol dehydrogenase [Subtercola boreus]